MKILRLNQNDNEILAIESVPASSPLDEFDVIVKVEIPAGHKIASGANIVCFTTGRASVF